MPGMRCSYRLNQYASREPAESTPGRPFYSHSRRFGESVLLEFGRIALGQSPGLLDGLGAVSGGDAGAVG